MKTTALQLGNITKYILPQYHAAANCADVTASVTADGDASTAMVAATDYADNDDDDDNDDGNDDVDSY